jgi:hypothetical protein
MALLGNSDVALDDEAVALEVRRAFQLFLLQDLAAVGAPASTGVTGVPCVEKSGFVAAPDRRRRSVGLINQSELISGPHLGFLAQELEVDADETFGFLPGVSVGVAADAPPYR